MDEIGLDIIWNFIPKGAPWHGGFWSHNKWPSTYLRLFRYQWSTTIDTLSSTKWRSSTSKLLLWPGERSWRGSRQEPMDIFLHLKTEFPYRFTTTMETWISDMSMGIPSLSLEQCSDIKRWRCRLDLWQLPYSELKTWINCRPCGQQGSLASFCNNTN